MMKPYQTCTACVMDTSDPEIEFDDAGVCNHCRTYATKAKTELFADGMAAERLGAIVQRMKREGQGKDYDCLIGVSGGVDSTYVAYKVKELGLRPLAVHMDNGWDSALAVTNIERTLQKLGIDLYTHVLDWDEFRDLQLSFLRASTPDSEIPSDHAIEAVLTKTALRHGIRYIIGGSNYATEGVMPRAWSQGIRDWRYIKSLHRRFGRGRLQSFPHLSMCDHVWNTLTGRIKFVHLLNYISYDKAEAMRAIQEELGWVYYGGKHYESVYTRFFQAYILPRKFGYDKRRAHLSTLICSGQLTRDEALEELKKEICPADLLEQDREFVIKKLGISASDFAAIMAAPPKSFSDYPSYEKAFWYGPAIKLYRSLRAASLARVPQAELSGGSVEDEAVEGAGATQ